MAAGIDCHVPGVHDLDKCQSKNNLEYQSLAFQAEILNQMKRIVPKHLIFVGLNHIEDANCNQPIYVVTSYKTCFIV